LSEHDREESGAQRSSARAAWVNNALTAAGLVLTALGGGGAGYLVGHSTTKTTTTTVRRVVTQTVRVPGPNPQPRPDATSCAPRPGRPGPSNDSPGHAAGPVVANVPVTGTIRGRNEVHYVALCLAKPAQLDFSIECTSGCDFPAYAEFPVGADLTTEFEPGRPRTCNVKEPGRYTLMIQSNDVGAGYSLSVQTKAADAVVGSLPANTPPPANLDEAC
jgi:hypothetical protein